MCVVNVNRRYTNTYKIVVLCENCLAQKKKYCSRRRWRHYETVTAKAKAATKRNKPANQERKQQQQHQQLRIMRTDEMTRTKETATHSDRGELFFLLRKMRNCVETFEIAILRVPNLIRFVLCEAQFQCCALEWKEKKTKQPETNTLNAFFFSFQRPAYIVIRF